MQVLNFTNLFNYPFDEDGNRLCLVCGKSSNNKIYCKICLEKYNLRCMTCDLIIIKQELKDFYAFKNKISSGITTHFCSRECYYDHRRKETYCEHPDCNNILKQKTNTKFCSTMCRKTNYKSRFIKKEDLHFCENCHKPFTHDNRFKTKTNCPHCKEATSLFVKQEDLK